MFQSLKSRVGASGLMIATIEVEHPDKVVLEGVKARGSKRWEPTADGYKAVVTRRNAFVNTGLNLVLDRAFALNSTPAAIGWIGVSSDSTAVTATTTFLNGAAGGTATNTIIKALSSPSRSSQTVTAGATFANVDFTSGVFAIHKVGLLNASTDAGSGTGGAGALIDVIGGAGTGIYNKAFTIDLTTAGSFSLTLQIQVTAVAA